MIVDVITSEGIKVTVHMVTTVNTMMTVNTVITV
jgi:hypothetical protein